jgi:hypothetical protein
MTGDYDPVAWLRQVFVDHDSYSAQARAIKNAKHLDLLGLRYCCKLVQSLLCVGK